MTNGLLISNDPTVMANIFNEFFAEIGEKISDSVQPTAKNADECVPCNYETNKPNFAVDHTGPVQCTVYISVILCIV